MEEIRKRKLPNWLKGGIIFLGIIILLTFFLWFGSKKLDIISDFYLLLPILPGLFLSLPLGNGCFTVMGDLGNCPISQDVYGVVVIMLNIAVYFSIGAVMGWLYGKIKKTKLK